MIILISNTSITNKCPFCGTDQIVAAAALVAGTQNSDYGITIPPCPTDDFREELVRTTRSSNTHAASVNGLFVFLANGGGGGFYAGKGYLAALPTPVNTIAPNATPLAPKRVGVNYAQRVSVMPTLFDVAILRAWVYADPDFLTDGTDGEIGTFVTAIWATEQERTQVSDKLKAKRILEFGA